MGDDRRRILDTDFQLAGNTDGAVLVIWMHAAWINALSLLTRAALILAIGMAILWISGLAYCARADPQIPASGGAQEALPATDLNILTGLDVSGSMEPLSIMLEVDGVAAAITSPEVLAAIQAGQHGRIGFGVFLWADAEMPMVAAWRVIATPEDAALAAAELKAATEGLAKRQHAYGGLTNLAGALDRASELLAGAPFITSRAVVNIVTDGRPTQRESDVPAARADLLARGVTINGMIVAGQAATVAYFRASVAGGRGSFVLTADRPEKLVYSFKRKFILDLAAASP